MQSTVRAKFRHMLGINSHRCNQDATSLSVYEVESKYAHGRCR